MTLVEPGDITDLIETGQFEEGVELEAKRASGQVPRNAWDSISTFANTLGGALVLGLEEGEDGWRVEGISDPDRMIQNLHASMRDGTKISHEVAGNGDIWKETFNGKHLVVVRVRAVSRRQKPVYINGNRDLAFVRRNEGDARCTTTELDRMRREATSLSFDSHVVPYLGLADFDRDTIQRYRTVSAEVRPDLPHHRLDTEAFLRAVGAWRTDREVGTEGPTVAGILMFGEGPAIGEVRANHMIDYQRIPVDSTPTRRWSDRVQWSGNLFGAWEVIFPRLVLGLPTPFRLRGPQRIDQPAGLEALREAFVNLLVHTDYQEPSDAVILHRYDGYTFRNPGDSWVDIGDIGQQGRSERRNPVLAQLFDHVGLADRAGSGFLRILDEWRELGFRNPNIVSDPARYEFELELSLASMLSADDRKWLAQIGGPWKEEEELALIFARHDGYVDNQSLRFATGQHLFDASQTLRSLRNRDLLILQGAGRNTQYVLGPAPGARQERPDSDHLRPKCDHKPAESDHKPDDDDHEPDEGDHPAHQVTYLHRESLYRVIMPLRETRRAPSSEDMRDAILQLCAIEPLSIAQLTDLFQRSKVTIRRYVQALQRERKLRRAEAVTGRRTARYETIPTTNARQQRLVIPEAN
jgi:ATP-dependent DNA helicase RecG